MSGPLSRFEHLQREQARRERRIRWTGYAILLLGAALIALGVWALVTLLIGAFG